MKCKVIFSDVQVCGDFSGDERNFTVGYVLDGDNCALCYNDGVLTQKRTGSVALALEFKHGEESICTIGEGEMSGTLPIFCEKLSVVPRDGVAISIVYLLGGEKMSLDINIKF